MSKLIAFIVTIVIIKGNCAVVQVTFLGEQGLRSGESNRLLPMWPRVDACPVRHVG